MGTEKRNYDNDSFVFEKDIYDLGLHESTTSEMCWGTRCIVTRVPGGWLYQYKSREAHQNGDGYDIHLNPVFVPYSENN